MDTFKAIDALIKGESEVKVGVGLTSQSLLEIGATLVAVSAIIMAMYFVAFKA